MRATFKTVRGLFTSPPAVLFTIPEYQRGFEWSKKNFEDLWIDLQRVGDRVDKHFLGNIILLRGSDSREREIVDGQQRMVTISILVMAIRHHPEMSGENNKIIEDILESQISGDVERCIKLYDDEADQRYEELWNGETCDVGGNIGAAYDYFSNQIVDHSKQDLKEILYKISQQLKVVRTEAQEPSLAYMIFQSQNERGVEVRPEVLIKARIFGEADRAKSQSETDQIKRKWKELYKLLEDNLSSPRFKERHVIRRPITQMLINHNVQTPMEIDKSALYRTFDEALQQSPSTIEFVENFHQKTKDYLKVSSSDYDVNAPNLSSKTTRKLQYLNSSSSHAETLTIAIINNGEEHRIEEYLHMATVLGMRSRLAGYRSSYRKKSIHSAAQKINNGEEIEEVLRRTINERGPDSGEIVEHIKSNTMTIRGQWRFRTLLTLVAIEEGRRGPLRVELDNLHIEHIAPSNTFGKTSRQGRSYSKWRRKLDEQEFEDEKGKNKLGNLTLLTDGDHARLDESSFNSKRNVYRNSDIRISEDVADYEVWDMEVINERSKNLGRELARIWSI